MIKMNEIEKIFNDFENLVKKNINDFFNSNHQWEELFNLDTFTQQAKVHEHNNKIYVTLKIPKLSKNHKVKVDLQNDNLVVYCTLNEEKEIKSNSGSIVSEAFSEQFYKTVGLPARATIKGARAIYEKGTLKIILNKIGELDKGNNAIDIEYR